MALIRTLTKMPEDVRAALAERGLMATYQARPEYQQNDYLSWITRAVRETTRAKRLAQMLDELEHGGVYMNMKWEPKAGTRSRGRHLKQSTEKREGRGHLH